MGKFEKKKENTILDGIDPSEDLNFFGIDLMDEKMFTMFIKKCEFLCRKSQEYDMWQRRTKALAIMQNSDHTKDDSENCPICGIQYQYAPAESHHHPITLFNLCVRQIQDWIDNRELPDKRPLDLVQEVMEKHLCSEVEHVVLCKHCHEKYHNREPKTNVELQKIIDYKRTLKIENYPDSVKAIVEEKRRLNKEYYQRKLDYTKDTLGNIQDGISKEQLVADILSESEYWEN